MEFIKDLVESRMYRRLSQFKGKDVTDIAQQMFSHLLMLRDLYELDKAKAMKYAQTIVGNLNFNGFRMSMPDLYNMIVMVMQQKKYADKLFNNWDVVLPEMRIKRIFRDMASGNLDSRDFAQLMLILQRRIDVDADQMRMRRIVQTPKLSSSDYGWMRKRLVQITRRPINSDLHEIYKKAVAK